MMGFNSNNGPIIVEQEGTETNTLLSKIFFRMFLGLLATALVATITYYSGMLFNIVMSGGMWLFIIAEFVVAMIFSFGFTKMSPGAVTALFYVYAMLTGVTLSSIFVEFELGSIAFVLFGTSAIFGILAYLGKNSKADLTSLGTVLSVSLGVALVVSIINLFVGNPFVDTFLDWIIIAIFMGFTIYDINNIVALENSGYSDDEHLYIYGAMQLYLDFINLFIRMLSLFGDRRRD